ncbi:MAG: Putative inner membrane protein YjeT (clustered with HflC), partial [uncultured Lysobacter sp.]
DGVAVGAGAGRRARRPVPVPRPRWVEARGGATACTAECAFAGHRCGRGRAGAGVAAAGSQL